MHGSIIKYIACRKLRMKIWHTSPLDRIREPTVSSSIKVSQSLLQEMVLSYCRILEEHAEQRSRTSTLYRQA